MLLTGSTIFLLLATMTKSTISSRNRDVADYLAQTSLEDDSRASVTEGSSKSTADTARLAQELASEASWADRYVPTTPSETAMTPSVASDHRTETEYMAPDEAPPTYELAVSSDASDQGQNVQIPEVQNVIVDQTQQPRPRPGGPQFGRDYKRVETSTSIHGDFTLHDSLDLQTTSGSINIRLDVKPGPQPAILKLKTNSGSITVNDRQTDLAQGRGPFQRQASSSSSSQSRSGGLFSWFSSSRRSEIAQPPPPFSDDPRKQPQQPEVEEPEATQYRAIHATIETSSGSVNAHLVLTSKSETSIVTSSGSIHLRIVTAGSGPATLSKLEQEDSRLRATKDLGSILKTASRSGSQNINVATGFGDTSSGAIISACRADYGIRGSGSLHVNYPREWIGLVHASSGGSGSINVRGSGLEYDKRGNGETWAWRGVDEPEIDDAVELRIDGSGSISFNC